jgi:tetratricopeptide (TPR) repeat protein
VDAAQARRLGAGILLSGALTRGTDVVHASLSMVDTVQNRILWGAQKDVPEGDLAGLAATLARQGVQELGLGATRKLYDSPMNLTGSPEMAASAELAETLGALRHRRPRQALEASLRLAQRFPEELDAQVLRAAALAQAAVNTRTREVQDELQRHVPVLRRLAPESPYVGYFETLEKIQWVGEVSKCTELLERDDLTPSLRMLILRRRGWGKRNGGDPEGGVADLEAALQLDPANAQLLADLAYILREAGRGEEALRRANQAVAMEPGIWWFRHAEGHVLSGLGRYEEAAEAYRIACEMTSMQQPCAAYAGSLAQAGHDAEALEAARRAGTMEDSSAGLYNLACLYALRGERDMAMNYLERTLELGWGSAWIASDPDLESLHGDPEFDALMKKMNEQLVRD